MRKALVLSLIVAGWPLAAGSWQSPSAGQPRVSQAARANGDEALLPAETAVPGWTKADKVRIFTSSDLYGYIDGGAELFLEFGFEQLTRQKYRNGANEIAVEIYRMADAAASSGIYVMKCGKETTNPAFRERHTVNRHQLMFVRNRYWVTVNNLSGSEGTAPALLTFGAAVASALPPHRAPATPPLPAQGQLPGTLRLVRGPVSLQSVYTLGEGDILQLGGKVLGAAANYNDASGPYTRLLVSYPTSTAAKAAFTNLQTNLDKYLKPVPAAPGTLVFRDYENKFGTASVNGSQLDIRLHLPKQPR